MRSIVSIVISQLAIWPLRALTFSGLFQPQSCLCCQLLVLVVLPVNGLFNSAARTNKPSPSLQMLNRAKSHRRRLARASEYRLTLLVWRCCS